jgi:SAM-dependent methyltransferase
MSSKHDRLTEEEMAGFRPNPALFGQLRALASAAAPIKILDWGCGRGRSVALLRQEGFDAFGIDIDRAVLQNGHDLFRARGLDPELLLRHADAAGDFEDGYFDAVFSEDTLEHVADLARLAQESFRLLRPGGVALHSFPGARWLIEPHVRMPLAHWLPPGGLRRLFMLRDEVMAVFGRAGFAGRWIGDEPAGWRRQLPAGLRDNGFPSSYLLLHLAKPS